MAEYKSSYTGTQIDAGIAKANTAAQPADLESKQDTLVSGTNIKTINNSSILGSGNLTIESTPYYFAEVQISGDAQGTKVYFTETDLNYIKNNTPALIKIDPADSGSNPQMFTYANEISNMKFYSAVMTMQGAYLISSLIIMSKEM